MDVRTYLDVNKYQELFFIKKRELAFCVAYFILASIICIYSVPRGSLFSPDSIAFVSDAENLFRNFPNYYQGAVYPALISIGMGLGLTSEQSAGFVPIMCYSLLGFPVFLIGKITSRPLAGYIACIICLLCGKYLLYVSTYAWTEMPYILISALAILCLVIYNKYGILSSVTLAGLFTFMAIFTRYIGIALIPAGIVLLVINNKGAKNFVDSLAYFCLIPIFFFILWIFKTDHKLFPITMVPSNMAVGLNPAKLPLDLTILKFKTFLEYIFFIDYKLTMSVIIFIIILSVVYLYLNKQIIHFIKDTIPISSYIFIYSVIICVLTSTSIIYLKGATLQLRYLLPIYPYILLIIVPLFIYAYDNISNRSYKIIFKAFSFVLLICLVAQGANSLYLQANSIRAQSLYEYPDRLKLNEYISEYNITDNDVVYFDWSGSDTSHFSLVLHQRTPSIKKRYIKSTSSKTTILDNLTLPFAGAGPASATSILDLIRENKNHSIYLIAPLRVLQNSIERPPNDICFINPVKFTKSFICMVDLKNNETCNASTFPRYYLIEGNSSIKATLAGNYMGHKHDQLLISNAKENTLQIIDFTKSSPAKIEYEDQPGAAWLTANHSLISGDFMGLGYDQALHIAGGVIIIEDFSRGKAPAITRYSEAPAKNSALGKLMDADDALLAGDFLGRGYSQVLFIDSNPKGRKLVIADFSKEKATEMTEFSEIEGNSTLLSSLLDDKDKQFAGDFMGLGYSQLLMINCNHTGAKEPKIIIADFSKGKKSASLRYLENWGESALFGGWLDANDTQLVGDFMGLGHSQVLFVNHGHAGGKIFIVDFSQGKPVGRYWESWDQGTIFQGWLDINDTRIAGDFEDLGYSQVLFINSSINGSNATIVEFINGKPEIAL